MKFPIFTMIMADVGHCATYDLSIGEFLVPLDPEEDLDWRLS